METFLNDEENPTVTIKDGLDLNDLRNNEEVCFEVQEEDEPPTSVPLDNNYFADEDVCNNLYVADEDDDDDDDDESTPFEKLARKMEDICPLKDGGIRKQLLKMGSGPKCTEGSVARVHFNAYLEYADEPFDSTRLQDKVKRIRIGHGTAVEGLEYALTTMRKNEVSRFLITSTYAYLPMGGPPRIPENSTILFEVEMLSFVEQAGIDDYFGMTEDEKREVPFSEVNKLYHAIVKEAKELYNAKRERDAFPRYKKAANLLENLRLKNAEEEKEWKILLVRVYLNLALCSVKQNHSKRAIMYCHKCQDFDKNNPKALYLKGKALHQLGEFEQSRDALKKAQKLKPSSRDINDELEKLEKNFRNYRFTEKDMYAKMFSKPKGESQEDKEKETKRVEEAKDKSLQCSTEFKGMVHEKLVEFKGNADLIELPMPSYSFTVGEIEYIIEAAEELGLQAKVRGSGQSAQLRVYKSNPAVSP